MDDSEWDDAEMRTFRRLWFNLALVLVILFFVGIAIAVWANSLSATQNDIWSSISRAGVGIAFTTVAGVIATGAFRLVDVRRGRDQERRKIFHDVVEAYNQIKSARRRLRALGLLEARKEVLHAEEVKELRSAMAELNDAQLRFEAIKRECEQSDLFTNKGSIITELGSVEAYVNYCLLKKWELNASRIWDGADPSVLDNLEVKDFIGRGGDRHFDDKVAIRLRRITHILQAELFGSSREYDSRGSSDDEPICR